VRVRPRLLLGVSILWLPLAFLTDGLTALVLPVQLASTAGGDTASVLGLVTFVALGVSVAIQPVAGVLADRYRARIERRLFITLGAVLVLPTLALLGSATTAALVAVSFLAVQVAASAVQAGQQSLIPEYVPSRGRGLAAGTKSAFDIGGSFAAFLVLGALLASGAGSAVVLIAVLLAVSVAAIWLLVPAAVPRDDATSWRARLPDGFVRLVVIRFLFLVGVYAVGRFLLLLVANRLGTDAADAATTAGGILALLTLVSAAGAPLFGAMADRHGREVLTATGVAISSLGIVVMAVPAGLASILVGGLLMSIGTAAFVPANWAATTDLTPAPDAARLMALANIGTGGAAACAGLLGLVVDAVGFGPAFAVAAGVTLLALIPLGWQRVTAVVHQRAW
jgi:MFS family permease